jgi:hypothetical protein
MTGASGIAVGIQQQTMRPMSHVVLWRAAAPDNVVFWLSHVALTSMTPMACMPFSVTWLAVLASVA